MQIRYRATILLLSIFVFFVAFKSHSANKECEKIDECAEGCRSRTEKAASCLPIKLKKVSVGDGSCAKVTESACICYTPDHKCEYGEEGLSEEDMKRLDAIPLNSTLPSERVLPNGEILDEYMKKRGIKIPDPSPPL